MTNGKTVKIIGGGLAGCECALQLLKRGFEVKMCEMRPEKTTGAHKTQNLAELVCSNSLKSSEPTTASGLLKDELDFFGCELLPLARSSAVPSGSALSVDRELFSKAVEKRLAQFDGFKLERGEITLLDDCPTVIATGPLTSPDMADTIGKLTGKQRLFFYDAIAPIVTFESVDMNFAYFGGRYGKGGEDYLNLPMNKAEYEAFYNELVNAETVVLHDFEKKELFDGCMPIEEMAKRGSDTIRFGPLKPIGLRNPKTNERAYAVVQLRKENVAGDCYNLVGFQTNLTYPEQKRVFSMIPALHDAEFVRYGVMHRNTYVNSPGVLDANFRLKGEQPIYIAGQVSGVEGYVESIMSGLVAGISLAKELEGEHFEVPSDVTIVGALARYISTEQLNFAPMNANFGILPQITGVRDKQKRKLAYHDRSINSLVETYGERFE
ncbi:MAG: methylenetetrahydrofolate--tRNA-(uracil(54)-C(5))-methyltransferase (FADH(2)-oxidizing) TrmFO [Clostridia bacterium]|nr:methylenetetrahydrofolate--tRNA-(uracil(54)-C(5))-methyltransferase (FADH(2)-oxidizing) TrmFO [Clostridia bacterium]